MRARLGVLVIALAAELSAAAGAWGLCSGDAQCVDTNPCSVDRCASGACVHLPDDAVCDDGNVCTDDLCDTSLGCLHANNGLGCNDAIPCTTQDTCVAGTCVGGAPAAGCTPCQAAAAIPAQGGTFIGRTSGTGTLTGSCGTSSAAPERVYAWAPTVSGTATISTCGSGTLYDSVVYVRSGACGGPEVGCNDDTAGCVTGEPNDHHGSRVTTTVTAGQTYYIVVDGYAGAAGVYALTVLPPSLCGNGLREGTEQCDGADSAACADGQCTAGCTCVVPPGGLPDLVPGIADVSVARAASVALGDVAEGCAEQSSNVDLLRFSVSSINAGTADLVLGDPVCPSPCVDHPLAVCGNPDFICSPAGGHNHPHYTHYARYELLDAASQTVVVGHKQGFCLRDTNCASPRYTCINQGISAGCYDVYGASLGCQYLDITGVPPGTYTLRVRMDPFARIPELNEANNVATVPVTLAGVTMTSTTSTTNPVGTTSTTSTTLPGGACAAATVLPVAGGTFAGVTSGASTLSTCIAQTATAPEQVFRWTPAVSGTAIVETCGSGTAYDTVVSVRSASCTTGTVIGCNDDTAGCATGDGCATADHHGSRVTFAVSAGQTYWVIVDGYAGSCGGSSGAFTLRLTPPAGAVTTTTVVPTTTTTATSTTTSTSRSTTTTAAPTTSTTQTSSSTSTSRSTTTTAAPTTSTTQTSSSTSTSRSTTTTSTSSTTSTTASDRCSNPPVIPAGGGSVKGKTNGGSTFSGTCAPTSGAPERVYRWTPVRSGIATIQTCDNHTRFDTVVYVRLGDCRLGGQVACNDDACDAASRVQPLVVAGLTYYIFVDGWDTEEGDFELRVISPP